MHRPLVWPAFSVLLPFPVFLFTCILVNLPFCWSAFLFACPLTFLHVPHLLSLSSVLPAVYWQLLHACVFLPFLSIHLPLLSVCLTAAFVLVPVHLPVCPPFFLPVQNPLHMYSFLPTCPSFWICSQSHTVQCVHCTAVYLPFCLLCLRHFLRPVSNKFQASSPFYVYLLAWQCLCKSVSERKPRGGGNVVFKWNIHHGSAEKKGWWREVGGVVNEIYPSLVRTLGCQCQNSNSHGLDHSICRHSGIWGTADKAVLNNVHKKKKSKQSPFRCYSTLSHPFPQQASGQICKDDLNDFSSKSDIYFIASLAFVFVSWCSRVSE